MRKDKAIVSYDAQILGEAQRINSQFSKVRIRVCYEGLNRHGEVISKETLTRAAENSLRLVPIVGHYLPEVNNFGGHDMALEIEGNELRLKNLTQAYGVVPETANFAWETVTEKNGFTQHEYLVCDGILWSGRYPTECNCILENGMNQSMEFMVDRWGETEDGRDEILDGEFSALCILGKSSDPEVNVEPCYEKAGIESYSLNDAVSEIIEAYKASLVEAVPETSEPEETPAEEEFSEEEVEESENPEEVEPESEGEEEAEPEDEEETEPEQEPEGEESPEEPEEVEESNDETPVEEPVQDYAALLEQYNAVVAENERMSAELSSLRTEVEELRNYRRSVEAAEAERDARIEFSDLEGDSEFEAAMQNTDMLLDRANLWERCYAMRGRKAKPTTTSYGYRGVKIQLIPASAEDRPKYGGIVDAYKRSNNSK